MKNLQITKRDVIIFILGMVAMILEVIICDWNDFTKGLSGKPVKESSEVSK